MPILLSQPIAKLPGGHAWLGGGEPDLKLRVDPQEFVKVMNAQEGFSAKYADVLG